MDYSQISSNDVDGFRANLNLAPQVTDSIYIPHVMADLSYSEEGKLFNMDEVGESDPVDVDTIVPDSPEGLVDQTRRVGTLKGFHDGKFIESIQKVHQLADPTNLVMEAMMAGKWRKHDSKIRESFFADVRTGEAGDGPAASLPSSQVIGVQNRKFLHQDEDAAASGDLPLTIGKLLYARSLLRKSNIKGGQLKIAVDSDDVSYLLSRTPTTSKYYANLARLEQGELDTFLGFQFLYDENLPNKTGDATTRLLPAWIDRAMVFKARAIHNATITPRADKSMRPYAYYESEHGAARRYDKGVVKIEAKKPS
ncbi:MAG TPA: phage capsid protein [Caulobacter sp.]|nr:phage capsid protein [Caulobacter sp.]